MFFNDDLHENRDYKTSVNMLCGMLVQMILFADDIKCKKTLKKWITHSNINTITINQPSTKILVDVG